MSDTSAKDRIRYRREHAVDPEAYLGEVGAIREVDEGDDIGFAEGFLQSIQDHLDRVSTRGVGTPEIAKIFGVDESEVSEPDRPYTAYKVIHTIWNWPSEGALLLDAATDAALTALSDDWEEVPPRQRYRILQAMRGFHDTCPFCGDTVTLDDTLVRSCCGDRQVYTVTCDGCARRLLEFDAPSKEGAGPIPS